VVIDHRLFCFGACHPETALQSASKPNDLSKDFHGDPFDRIIVATAAALNLTLITADAAIRDAKQGAVEYYPFKSARA
jgi:PIN domain nuclease of toxin-antitoxin system